MANSNIKDLIFEHGQRYVREVLADHLREEGFISKNDVHWYRLINNQILQYIFFHTSHTFFRFSWKYHTVVTHYLRFRNSPKVYICSLQAILPQITKRRNIPGAALQ